MGLLGYCQSSSLVVWMPHVLQNNCLSRFLCFCPFRWVFRFTAFPVKMSHVPQRYFILSASFRSSGRCKGTFFDQNVGFFDFFKINAMISGLSLVEKKHTTLRKSRPWVSLGFSVPKPKVFWGRIFYPTEFFSTCRSATPQVLEVLCWLFFVIHRGVLEKMWKNHSTNFFSFFCWGSSSKLGKELIIRKAREWFSTDSPKTPMRMTKITQMRMTKITQKSTSTNLGGWKHRSRYPPKSLEWFFHRFIQNPSRMTKITQNVPPTNLGDHPPKLWSILIDNS